MRLISAHIDNFGKYSNQRFDFDSSLSTYCLDNGEGKTTLAAFIRVMLYGMSTDRKGGKEFSERIHYDPFQGGSYGGSLELEWQGKRYKIVRTFDAKSETKDKLSVYCTISADDTSKFVCVFRGQEVGKCALCICRRFDECFFVKKGSELRPCI